MQELRFPRFFTVWGGLLLGQALLDQYVFYFNNKRQHAALGYKSPVQYKTELGFR